MEFFCLGIGAIFLISLRLGKISLLLLPALLGTEEPTAGFRAAPQLLLCSILLETRKFKLHQLSPCAKEVRDVHKYHYLFIFPAMAQCDIALHLKLI